MGLKSYMDVSYWLIRIRALLDTMCTASGRHFRAVYGLGTAGFSALSPGTYGSLSAERWACLRRHRIPCAPTLSSAPQLCGLE
jgi:hypothetical protein